MTCKIALNVGGFRKLKFVGVVKHLIKGNQEDRKNKADTIWRLLGGI